jgi:hypothetical protein
MKELLVFAGVGLVVYYLIGGFSAPAVATTTNVGTTASAATQAGTVANTPVTQVTQLATGGSSCVVGGTSYYSSTATCPPPGMGK